MKKRYINWIVVFIIAIAVGIYVIYSILFIPHGIDIDKEGYPITGIDISSHTGKIDFDKIKDHDIDFVFFKSTEGEDFTDKQFEENYKGLKQIDIPIGVYHFFRFNKSGISQASNFLSAVGNKQFELPFVLDIEEWRNHTTKTSDEVIKEIAVFINEIENRTGKKIIIYTNENGYNKYLKDNFNKYDIWICSFNEKPNIDRKWIFWQHSHKGKFDFAKGWVDINTFNGNKEDFENYLIQ